MGESDIQKECRKLQETAQALEANWRVEVTAYELQSLTNKPNNFGTVTEETLFPYDNDLYPLLDCFDGLIDKHDTAGPAPLPLSFRPYNGHRRKRSRPNTIDPHGAEILELTMLEGHLPNSAWAIRQAIMPHERREQFANDNESKGKAQNAEEHQHHHPPVREVNDGQMHPNPRFFNMLMDPSTELTHIASSNISIPPLIGDDDGNSDWEDIDEDFYEDNVNDDEIDVYSNGNLARNFTFLFWWEQKIISERKGIPFPSTCTPQKSISSFVPLLKVLMHSLSELQSDHRLARAVLLRLADCKACSFDESTNIKDAPKHDNEFECLRQLLSVLSLGCTPCDGYCHETYIGHENVGDLLDDSLNINPPNHYCQDIWELFGSVSTLFAYGIENMTQQHASIICAFFIREWDIDSVESETENSSRQKAYLKQNIQYFSRDIGNERDDDEEDTSVSATHVHLLSAVLNGIRLHAVSDRMRLDSLLDVVVESTDDDIASSVRQASQSYKTCVDILVDIGERILLRLPTNWQNRQLGGMVLRGLLEACMDNTMKSSYSSYYMVHNEGTLRSVIDPLRYADAVKHPLVAPTNNGENKRATPIGLQPSRDVLDVVKGLFRRDLVDLYVSGCGYGDFICWCNLPIFPEPLLFDYITNFPQDNKDEEPPQQYEWVQDNDGLEVDYPHLVACYDFSLLMLLREWNKPWTPQSHLSFSIPHRQAISFLALCAHRFGVPASIVEIVNSFLPRAWWHDDRCSCWCRECQFNKLAALFQEKVSLRTSNWNGVALPTYDSTTQSRPRKPMTTCSGCGVVSVCSKDHLKRLQREGHKRQCGLPPFRPPFGKEENIFVQEIFGANDESIDDNEDIKAETDENVEEDEVSWESVASNEEERHMTTMRDKIYAWFNDRSYKIQRREAPALPFANFM